MIGCCHFYTYSIITIIVSRNSVKLHCFDTKSYIWYRIFFENSTIILSMTVMQNCIFNSILLKADNIGFIETQLRFDKLQSL